MKPTKNTLTIELSTGVVKTVDRWAAKSLISKGEAKEVTTKTKDEPAAKVKTEKKTK